MLFLIVLIVLSLCSFDECSQFQTSLYNPRDVFNFREGLTCPVPIFRRNVSKQILPSEIDVTLVNVSDRKNVTDNTTTKQVNEKPIESFDEWTKKRRDAATLQNPVVSGTPVKEVREAGPKRNFASRECGAKVIATNPEAENGKAVVNDKDVDDYLRNPCEQAKNKFIVIELCESIQIQKIAIGNFELFASRPKQISVFISERYPPTEWLLIGTFQLLDIRKLQTLIIENTSNYAKYVKITLDEHYGNEHYCIVSVVNVFGTTLADEYDHEENVVRMITNEVVSTPAVEETSVTPPPSVETFPTQLPIPPIRSKPVLSIRKWVNACTQTPFKRRNQCLLICRLFNIDQEAVPIQKSPRKPQKRRTSLERGWRNHRSMLQRFSITTKTKHPKDVIPVVIEEKKPSLEQLISQTVEEPTPVPQESKILPGGSSNQRESIIMKLSKRITAVELNLTLSTEYLSALSKQYVNQMNGFSTELEKSKNSARQMTRNLEAVMRLKIMKQQRELKNLRRSLFAAHRIPFGVSETHEQSCYGSRLKVTRQVPQIEDKSTVDEGIKFEKANHLIPVLLTFNTFAVGLILAAVVLVNRRNTAVSERRLREEFSKQMEETKRAHRKQMAQGMRRAEAMFSILSEKNSCQYQWKKELLAALAVTENETKKLFAEQDARIDDHFEVNRQLIQQISRNQKVSSEQGDETTSETEDLVDTDKKNV